MMGTDIRQNEVCGFAGLKEFDCLFDAGKRTFDNKRSVYVVQQSYEAFGIAWLVFKNQYVHRRWCFL